MNTKPLIAFFGSSRRLLRQVREIAEEDDRNIQCIMHALDEAVAPAIKAVEEDCAEVIISYRGTADILKKNVHIPVLTVQNIGIYKVDAISRLIRFAKNIIIPHTVHERVDARRLSEFCGVRVHALPYSDAGDLRENLRRYRQAFSDGTVVSGGLALRIAREFGLRHYLVVPDKAHIRDVIDNAVSIAAANRENELWLRSAEAILNNVSDGVLAVNTDGYITLCNKQACALLSLNERDAIGRPLRELLPELMPATTHLRPRQYFIQQIGRTRFVFNCAPLELRTGTVGVVFTFNSARRVIAGGKLVSRAVSRANRARYTLQDYIHTSPLIDSMLMQLRLYAGSDSTVLITGGSGTGKEILAHALHNCSARHNRPFVSINCAAIPEQLLESELFGYEGGTFTGSLREGKMGLFENADTGTIFIDEVNSLPPNVQLLLLRALQEKEIRRIGSDTVIPLNIRVIAATNKSLIDEVLAGRMREDLFFRLNVLVLDVPPLNRHADDIPVLARHFARKHARAGDTETLQIPDDCLQQLTTLPWPGNIRELEHFIERLVLLCDRSFSRAVFDSLFTATQAYQYALRQPLPADTKSAVAPTAPPEAASPSRPEALTAQNGTAADDAPLSVIDARAIDDALRACGGRKGLAARRLGVSRVTLWRLMRKHRIG